MPDQQDRLNELYQQLAELLKKQELFAKELMDVCKEVDRLKKENTHSETVQDAKDPVQDQRVEEPIITSEEMRKEALEQPIIEPPAISKPPLHQPKKAPRRSDWEKFIGENLINKIGIIVTIIGVVIGAKYSIENNLISPLTRIILGYLAGLALLGFGIKLKSRYENYSAVLVSGALTILYFITFSAYSFYELIPQSIAFGFMVFFTAFGVIAALNYNRQIIAHIGLVGAYAIPFLLSDNSGNAAVLFSYMVVINIGIAIIAFWRYWKPLYYVSFVFSWLIYGSWVAFSYEINEHFVLALVFLSIFFLIFYSTFLAYKLNKKESFRVSDIILLLLNSFIFYGFGYGMLSDHETGKQLLGLFTLGNAIVHFAVSIVVFRKKLVDKNLLYLISGLVLVFITIAIPVQLDGNWVTLLWTAEAALLYWIGSRKDASIYQYLSYPLMILAFASLLQDWSASYGWNSYINNPDGLAPFFNQTFLTSLLFLLAFGYITWLNNFEKNRVKDQNHNAISRIMDFGIPLIFLLTFYWTFHLEIANYWDTLYENSEIVIDGDDTSYPSYYYNFDLHDFKRVWIINYTLIFISTLSFVNTKWIKNRLLGIATLSFHLITLFVFLSWGLYLLSELRESYIGQTLSEYYDVGFINIGVRYISIAILALSLIWMRLQSASPFMKINFKVPFEILMHICIIWIASSELLNIMDLASDKPVYKLGLSIFWGIYALLLIGLGIWKNKKYLRVLAFVFFGIILLKLFFYDIATLNTISKTIVFVSLGVLLLISSFLYNKYKNTIYDESEN